MLNKELVYKIYKAASYENISKKLLREEGALQSIETVTIDDTENEDGLSHL